MTLHDQINEMGAGSTPSSEIPARPKPRTTLEKKAHYDKCRIIILRMLQSIIKENERFVADDGVTPRFICHPEGVVHISIPASKWHLVNHHQYPIPHALFHLTNKCIERWYQAGKIVDAPAGCIFISPLLVAPK